MQARQEYGFFIGVGLAYVFIRWVLFQVFLGQDYNDTVEYFAVAEQTGWAQLAAVRPIVYPYFIELFANNITIITWLQWSLSIIATLYFTWVLTRLLSDKLAKLTYLILLIFFIMPIVSQWDVLILTESLTISSLLLLAAVLIRQLSSRRYSMVLILATTLLIFIAANLRDTNAYLVLLLLLCLWGYKVFFSRDAKKLLVTFYLIVSSLSFAVSHYFADLGEHWAYPFRNMLAARFVCQVDQSLIQHFEKAGLPVAQLNQFEPGTYDLQWYFVQPGRTIPKVTLDDYHELFAWTTSVDSKQSYQAYLLTNPYYSLIMPLSQHLIQQEFALCPGKEAVSYPSIPMVMLQNTKLYYAAGIAEPYQWAIAILLLLFALFLVVLLIYLLIVRHNRWQSHRLGWFLLLALAITLLHSFIAWHGDTNEIHRHTIVNVVLLYLWMLAGVIYLLNLDKNNTD